MKYLKEDGSLDVERIKKLPREEFNCVIGNFTREQMEEFLSKLSVNYGPIKPVKVDYKMEDLLAKGWATTEQILKMIEDRM